MTKILLVVGARPNFMKIAPVMDALASAGSEFTSILVHTGQHYDSNMSQVFFDELGMPTPDLNLGVGSGTHAWQTAEVMKRFEPVLLEHRPNWLVVPGDVNSTLACALVAAKVGIPVVHLEAGLRSFDRTMPEEINRLLTDQIADALLIPSLDARTNLVREGIPQQKIFFVGNVMIDTLVRLLPAATRRLDSLLTYYGLHENYALVTLHRPSNVDDPATLRSILDALDELSRSLSIIFPVHPRTRHRIESEGLAPSTPRIRFTDPLGYLDFLALESRASFVITDSGGIQEETTYLGIPCLTLRPNTERPITVLQGTNRLITASRESLVTAASEQMKNGRNRKRKRLRFWDGHAGERVVQVLRCLSLIRQ